MSAHIRVECVRRVGSPYWTEESAALTESQSGFEKIVLDAKKLTMYGEIPNELIAGRSCAGRVSSGWRFGSAVRLA
jgi:hypothetical protein